MKRLPILTLPILTMPLIAGSLAMSLLAAAAQAPSQRGHALLDANCARCHAIEKTGKSPHEAAPPFRTLGDSFDLNEFSRRLSGGLASGHPDMPVFKFNADDARAVSAYLRSIQE